MTSLLDDANKMLELQYGDILRLQQIKKTLEQNKMLFVSDRQYLCKLTQEQGEKPLLYTSKYYSQKNTSTHDSDKELEELEEKIRVETEPS
jgi:hypothetical protein